MDYLYNLPIKKARIFNKITKKHCRTKKELSFLFRSVINLITYLLFTLLLAQVCLLNSRIIEQGLAGTCHGDYSGLHNIGII